MPVTRAKVKVDIAAASWNAADCIAIADARRTAFRRMGNEVGCISEAKRIGRLRLAGL